MAAAPPMGPGNGRRPPRPHLDRHRGLRPRVRSGLRPQRFPGRSGTDPDTGPALPLGAVRRPAGTGGVRVRGTPRARRSGTGQPLLPHEHRIGLRRARLAVRPGAARTGRPAHRRASRTPRRAQPLLRRAARPLRGRSPRTGSGRLRARRRLRLLAVRDQARVRPPARRHRRPDARRSGEPRRQPVPARGVLRPVGREQVRSQPPLAPGRGRPAARRGRRVRGPDAARGRTGGRGARPRGDPGHRAVERRTRPRPAQPGSGGAGTGHGAGVLRGGHRTGDGLARGVPRHGYSGRRRRGGPGAWHGPSRRPATFPSAP
ncbi:hypothetical protein RKD37_008475 [Streptomyces ambofaciens]